MKQVDLKKLVNFVIAYCNIHGFVITPMKLQKILYYIQAWYLVKYEKELLFDELPQAWVNGPVYRSIYDQYKTSFYRSTPLILKEIKEVGKDEKILKKYKDLLELADDQTETINVILKHYSPQEESKLVLMTHRDAPWNIAREGYGEFDRCEETITAESMYSFYKPVSS